MRQCETAEDSQSPRGPSSQEGEEVKDDLNQRLRDEHSRRTGWQIDNHREMAIRIALDLLLEAAEKKAIDGYVSARRETVIKLSDLREIVGEMVK